MLSPLHTRRRVTALSVSTVALTALLLTGCGRSTDTTASSPNISIDDATATGTLEFWAPGADADDVPELLQKFEEANPDLQVNVTPIPNDDFPSKMTAAISAGTVPDLVYITTEAIPGMLATGGFAPVPDGLVSKDDFFDVAWSASVVDAIAYGVPWYTYAQTFQYRSDLADAAGAAAPGDWDELRTFAQKLKDTGVQAPIAFQVDWDVYTAQELNVLAHQNGGGLLSEDGSTWTIDSAENVEALEFWAGLISDGFASADGPAFLDRVPYFSNGTNAAELNGPWFPGWLDDANGADWSASHVAMTVPPAGPDGDRSSSVGGGNLFVPADAKNSDAAWKAARYMAEPGTQVEWYSIFGNLPANSTAWEDPAIADAPDLDTIRQSIEIGTTIPRATTWGEVGQVIASAMEQVARNGTDARAALESAQAQAESIGTVSRR